MEDGDTEKYHVSSLIQGFVFSSRKMVVSCVYHRRYIINRGSYMSTRVLLNLLNELSKRDKMCGLSSILSLFRNKFNKFNNTKARM